LLIFSARKMIKIPSGIKKIANILKNFFFRKNFKN